MSRKRDSLWDVLNTFKTQHLVPLPVRKSFSNEWAESEVSAAANLGCKQILQGRWFTKVIRFQFTQINLDNVCHVIYYDNFWVSAYV